jgi:hypothetical protein
MPTLTPGTKEYRDYYNAVDPTPPVQQQPKQKAEDDPFKGADARGKAQEKSGTGRARADMSTVTREKAPAASATAKAVTTKRATVRADDSDRTRADMSSIRRSDPFRSATASGKAGTPILEAVDVTAAKPTGKGAKAAVLRAAFIPFKEQGGYDLVHMVLSGVSANRMHEAGFSDEQIGAAIVVAMKRNYGAKAAQEIEVMAAGCCGPWVPEKERVDALEKVMDKLHAKLAADQDARAIAQSDAAAESARTHVALPGTGKTWYHWPTGRTLTDEEYRKATNNGTTTSADEYSRSAPEARRGAIEAAASLFFLPVQAGLPEKSLSEQTAMDYFVGLAQIATWLSPLTPKGVGAALTAGAGSVFGVATARNWDAMSTVNKVASVAVSATLFVSGVRGVLQPSFKPVTIPLKDGGKAVVWSGLSVRGQRAIGITRLPPKYTAVAEGWQPVTRLETTVAGTRSALKTMGVPETEIDRLSGTLDLGRSIKGVRSRYEPTQVSVEDVAPQALTPDELAIVLRQAYKTREYVEMVFGSTTMKPQLEPGLRNWRQLGDVEIQFGSKTSAERVSQIAKDMLADLEKRSPGRFSIDATGMRLVSEGHHAVELKLPNDPAGTGVGAPRQRALGAWDIEFHESPIAVEYPGIGTLRIMRLSESGVRKMASITELSPEGFQPPAHRTKDIIDFYVIVRTLKGKATADRWAALYGLEPDEAMAAAAKNPPVMDRWAYDPAGARTGSRVPTTSLSLPADTAEYVRRSSPSLYRDLTSPITASPAASLRQQYSTSAPSPSKGLGSPSPASPTSPSRVVSPSSPSSPSKATSPSSPASPSKAVSPSSPSRASRAASPTSPTSPSSPRSLTSPPSPASPSSPASPRSPGSPASPRVPVAPLVPVRDGQRIRTNDALRPVEERSLEPSGRVQWKQGNVWIMVEPPPTEGERQRNVYYSRRPFWGVRVVKGSPEETFAHQGNPPKWFRYEMGITRADIFAREKPHLRYRQTRAGRANNRRGRRRGRLI